ncbi:MAG: DUF6797 domain-containing protein [Opitutaceae bacterium]
MISPPRLAWLLLLGLAACARADVRVERGYLPHGAAPSSFAVALPGGVNFCFDPVRGGVSYVWTGGFLDLAPMRPGPGKFIQPAGLEGRLVHREEGVAPLRRGDPAKVPEVIFTGYALRDDAIEFRYTVDGAAVQEEVRVKPGGGTLVRTFHFPAGNDTRWWRVLDGRPPERLVPGADGKITLEIPLGRTSP